jgi:hypothetical protein
MCTAASIKFQSPQLGQICTNSGQRNIMCTLFESPQLGPCRVIASKRSIGDHHMRGRFSRNNVIIKHLFILTEAYHIS